MENTLELRYPTKGAITCKFYFAGDLNPFNPLTIIGHMWQAYALSGILCGSEIVTWDDTNMKMLDVIQNNLIWNVLWLPQYVATVGLEIISKITPVWWYIMCRKIKLVGQKYVIINN